MDKNVDIEANRDGHIWFLIIFATLNNGTTILLWQDQ